MKKNTILFFVLLIAASLLLFIHTFSVLAHTPERTGGEGLWVNFLMNLPCCILIGYADYRVAKSLQKRFRRTVVCTSIQHRGQRIPYYVMEQPYRAFHRTVFL